MTIKIVDFYEEIIFSRISSRSYRDWPTRRTGESP